MKVAPIFTTPARKQNFNGLLIQTNKNSYDDNAQETTVNSVSYDYYPFKNESEESIKKVINNFSKYELDEKPAPAWNTLYQSTVNIKATLPITAQEYAKATVVE